MSRRRKRTPARAARVVGAAPAAPAEVLAPEGALEVEIGHPSPRERLRAALRTGNRAAVRAVRRELGLE